MDVWMDGIVAYIVEETIVQRKINQQENKDGKDLNLIEPVKTKTQNKTE